MGIVKGKNISLWYWRYEFESHCPPINFYKKEKEKERW